MSEETLLCIREQSLSREASQSAVRRRWLSLCTVWPLHSQWPSKQISFVTTKRLPILHPSLQPRFGSLRHLAIPKAKITVEKEKICECDGYTVHKLSQRRLTADW